MFYFLCTLPVPRAVDLCQIVPAYTGVWKQNSGIESDPGGHLKEKVKRSRAVPLTTFPFLTANVLSWCSEGSAFKPQSPFLLSVAQNADKKGIKGLKVLWIRLWSDKTMTSSMGCRSLRGVIGKRGKTCTNEPTCTTSSATSALRKRVILQSEKETFSPLAMLLCTSHRQNCSSKVMEDEWAARKERKR